VIFTGSRLAAPIRRKESKVTTQAESLRRAIENLIDAKLFDAMSKPGGLDRLIAHRTSGVASYSIRMAGRKLEDTLTDLLGDTESDAASGRKFANASR